MDILTLSGIMAVCRDNYKTKYLQLKKELDDYKKEVRDNYKPDSVLAKQEVQKAKEKFNDAVEKLKTEVKEFAEKNINELRELELHRVKQIDSRCRFTFDRL